jgi:hypothetical protein
MVEANNGNHTMREAKRRGNQLGVRVSGIHGAPQSLQRLQAAGGLHPISSFAWPAGQMDGFMEGASGALEDGGLGSTSFLERGRRQAEIPEKVLNR